MDDKISQYFGAANDRESSIHNLDLTKIDMDNGMGGNQPGDGTESQYSVNQLNFGAPSQAQKNSSRHSQSSARKSTTTTKTKKKAPTGAANTSKTSKTGKSLGGGGGNISDTASVKSGKSKAGGGGTKKKKKKAGGSKDSSIDGDTSRSIIMTNADDLKPEEPVILEKPKREFKESEKVKLMEKGVDMLR